MVSISRETPDQTRARLRSVIGRAEMRVLDGAWSYFQTPADSPPALDDEVLAVVRDEDSWSVLRPADRGDATRERFAVLSFHFPPREDNSGFVGWLATELKDRLGTGLVVVCGSNSDRGGIYDYWGCPVELLDDVLAVIALLRATDADVAPGAH
ncbi:hypothetical protein F6B41_05250 [Microbacterium lushaniae]|nr:hypothetical protein F6B41_09350 [Microbacterium lushaniae]KAA9157684.1 hypothetical protein F6B41_05250 [Microbacterium lushaniae]